MTHTIIDFLRGSGSPSDCVLESGSISLSRSALIEKIENLASQLRSLGVGRVALYGDNGIEWIVSDLACQLAGICIVPLPLFFSDSQVLHAIASGGVDAVITDRGLPAALSGATRAADFRHCAKQSTRVYRVMPSVETRLPVNTQKVTFTSGTTGTPKGVCLSASQQMTLASSLAETIDIERPRHLCLLPLSTLLENLAGVYAPLIAGGTVVAPPLADVGLTGSSGLDLGTLLQSIQKHRPDSLILVPEILKALTMAATAGWHPPQSLRFAAVGGGKVAPELLRQARGVGIPAFEGYGLSECSSVVSLNVPAGDNIGSVGRPLPHVTVTTENGEIIISGSTFLGYANQPDSWGSTRVHTGDAGHIASNGFVHVDGRIKHQFISSFGRNLSPEWVESELLAGPLLQQAVVVGDDRPFCTALVYTHDAAASDQDIATWIRMVNLKLPDYARVVSWHRLPQALSVQNDFLTANGRPKRANIEVTYQPAIDAMYEVPKEVSNL